MRLNLRHLYLIFALTMLTTACGKGFKASHSLGSISRISEEICTTLKPIASPSNFLAQSKVEVGGDSMVARGTALVVELNSVCMSQNEWPSELSSNEELIFSPAGSAYNSYNIRPTRDISASELTSVIESHPCFRSVSKDFRLKTSALPNDPQLNQARHLAAINFQQSYDFFTSAPYGVTSDIIVAVIDTGLDLNHPDIRERLWINTLEAAGQTGVDDDNNGFIDDINGYDFADNDGDPSHKGASVHGTHTAGLIAAANNNGINGAGIMGQHARIMVLNVFDADEGASLASLDRAIRYAADNGAKVINMSLGGEGQSPTTANALGYAIQKGAIVVVAAGNEARQLNQNYFVTPASYGSQFKGVITVGASDANDTTRMCVFSNFSSTNVEIAAPGCDTARQDLGLLSLLPNNSTGYLAGTSMAAPVVSGSAALIIAALRDRANLNLTPAAVEDLLLADSPVRAPVASVAGGKHLDLQFAAEALRNNQFRALLNCQ